MRSPMVRQHSEPDPPRTAAPACGGPRSRLRVPTMNYYTNQVALTPDRTRGVDGELRRGCAAGNARTSEGPSGWHLQPCFLPRRAANARLLREQIGRQCAYGRSPRRIDSIPDRGDDYLPGLDPDAAHGAGRNPREP